MLRLGRNSLDEDLLLSLDFSRDRGVGFMMHPFFATAAQ